MTKSQVEHDPHRECRHERHRLQDEVARLTADRQAIAIEVFVQYEIAASWWNGFICIGWMQDLSARYFVWKATRKYRRYKTFLKIVVRRGRQLA